MIGRRGPILIVLSLVLAFGAAWVANRWVQARTSPAGNEKTSTITVVVASMDLPFGTKIEPRHLSTIQMLPGSAPGGAFHEPKKVEGKVTRAGILQGEILLEGRFTDQGSGSTLAAVVEKNMRAVSVRVDDVVGVGGFLLPGNRVDILGTRDLANREAHSETILQNVRVLAVDQTASTDKNEPVVVRAVTLEVTPEQAETTTRGVRPRSRSMRLATMRMAAASCTEVPPNFITIIERFSLYSNVANLKSKRRKPAKVP